MSRFIPEGKSDLKSLQKVESEAANQYANEQEEKETLSLYEQMKANYIEKERAYEEKVKAKNQSHAIDERELEFYNKLEQDKQHKEIIRKRELEEGLEEFEKKKKATKAPVSESVRREVPEINVPKNFKQKSGNAKVKVKTLKSKVTNNTAPNLQTEANNKDTQLKEPPKRPGILLSNYLSSSDSDSD